MKGFFFIYWHVQNPIVFAKSLFYLSPLSVPTLPALTVQQSARLQNCWSNLWWLFRERIPEDFRLRVSTMNWSKAFTCLNGLWFRRRGCSLVLNIIIQTHSKSAHVRLCACVLDTFMKEGAATHWSALNACECSLSHCCESGRRKRVTWRSVWDEGQALIGWSSNQWILYTSVMVLTKKAILKHSIHTFWYKNKHCFDSDEAGEHSLTWTQKLSHRVNAMMIRTPHDKMRHLLETFSCESKTDADNKLKWHWLMDMKGSRGRKREGGTETKREEKLYPMRLLKPIQARKQQGKKGQRQRQRQRKHKEQRLSAARTKFRH